MDIVEERIRTWEAAGLIDSDTARRLIDHEMLNAPGPAPEPPTEPSARAPGGAAEMFGPAVSVGEMFGYIGGGFILGSVQAFIIRGAVESGERSVILPLGLALIAAVLTMLAVWLSSGPDRRRRAAGVAFLFAVGHVAASATAFVQSIADPTAAVTLTLGALAGLVAAIAFRAFHPTVLTQIGLIAGITSLTAALLALANQVVGPQPDPLGPPIGGADPLLLVVGTWVAWLACAILIGFIGLREARRGDSMASRRGAASRFWAGLVAVLGTASAVTMTTITADGIPNRVLEPWIGVAAIVVVSAILIERAFRREASSYVYPAAIGLIVAATDLNFTYFRDANEIGLLFEGLVLLGVGMLADRIRRRVVRAADPAPPGADAVEAAPAG